MSTIQEIKDDQLTIYYRGKKHIINVSSELAVSPHIINKQLEQAPSNYAFLCLLRDKYVFRRDKLERSKMVAYSKAWVFYKEAGNTPNDLADNKAATHPKYISISERLDKLNYKVNRLISICRAYESRDRILQTISANLRKQ